MNASVAQNYLLEPISAFKSQQNSTNPARFHGQSFCVGLAQDYKTNNGPTTQTMKQPIKHGQK